jgi:hypothetical protein
MRFPSFIGGSYESQALTADCSRTINWFPEMLEDAGATSRAVLYPTPGVEQLSSVAVGNGRGHIYVLGREFAVIGSSLVEVGSSGAATVLGTVALDSNPATLTSNGDLGSQLLITSGSNAYLLDMATNTLSAIAALAGKATHGGYLDGYFLALDAATSTLYFSALGDGASWTTGVDYAQRSLAPDRWLSMIVAGRYIWLFGETTSEVWYDTGQRFPFAPAPSGFLTYGIAAPYSAGIIGQDVIWLAATATGKTCVVRAQGFTPQVISTFPLETAFHGYSAVVAAVSDVYSERGHTFYLLSFDRNDVTWAWDATTNLWCERGTWLSGDNRFASWRPRFYAFAHGEHRMLDASGGSIYRMSSAYVTDVDGLPIRRLRRAPAINAENRRVFYPSLELDLEPGLGDPHPAQASFTMAETSLSRVVGTVTWDTTNVWVGIQVTLTVDDVPFAGDGHDITHGAGGYSFDNVPSGTVVVGVTGDPGPGTRSGSNTAAHVSPGITELNIDATGA